MTNTPKLRFKEFNEEWVKLKIEDVVDVIDGDRGENYPKESEFSDDGYCLFLNAKNVTKNGFDFKEKKFITEFKDKKLRNGKLELNDLVLTTRGTIGNIAYYTSSIPYKYIRINSGMVVLKSKCIFHGFLYSYVKSHYFEKQVMQTCYGSAQPQLTVKGINNFKVAIPSIEEQEKIASFFSLIDKKIELQTEKVEELKNYKKGIMQKIFSQELRFKDENGNEYPKWKLGKLGDYLINKGGTALEKYVGDKGTHNFISIGNYSVDGNYIDTGQRISLNDKTQEKLLNKNDLVMVLNDKTASGDLIGSTILIDEDNKYIYNQRSERLICNSNIYPDFCWILLNSEMFRRKVFSLAQGGTQIYVNFSSVKNLEIELPHLKEQEKIIHFIFNINTKLNKEQEKLEYLNQYKKGLLQQMFI